MTCIFACISVLCMISGLDRQSFSQLLESQWSQIVGFSCEFEGNHRFCRSQDCLALKIGPDGIFDNFSGTFTFRMDNSAILDRYSRVQPQNRLHRNTLSILGDRSEVYSRNEDEADRTGTVGKAYFGAFDNAESYGIIFYAYVLRGYLKFAPAGFFDEGSSSLGGRPCHVISFTFGVDPLDQENSKVERYWIDLERGGHVVQRERSRKRKLIDRAKVESKQFKAPEAVAKPIWLPYHGIIETYLAEEGDQVVHVDKPTQIVNIWLLPDSLKFPVTLPDSRFSVKYKPGTPITDSLRQAAYEFGQDRRPPAKTPVEAQKRLEEHLAEADAQKDELKASSAARGGPGWAGWLPWTTAAGAVGLLAVVLVRRGLGR